MGAKKMAEREGFEPSDRFPHRRFSKPSTFISMTAATAKKRILRRLRRAKNRIIADAVPLP